MSLLREAELFLERMLLQDRQERSHGGQAWQTLRKSIQWQVQSSFN